MTSIFAPVPQPAAQVLRLTPSQTIRRFNDELLDIMCMSSLPPDPEGDDWTHTSSPYFEKLNAYQLACILRRAGISAHAVNHEIIEIVHLNPELRTHV